MSFEYLNLLLKKPKYMQNVHSLLLNNKLFIRQHLR